MPNNVCEDEEQSEVETATSRVAKEPSAAEIVGENVGDSVPEEQR